MSLKEKIHAIQQEIGALKKENDNPYFKSKYVNLDQILEALQPLEEKYRVLITQPIHGGLTNKEATTTRMILMLIVQDLDSDEAISYDMVLPDYIEPQKLGSAITYFRRYALQSFFMLRAEDDDANDANDEVENKIEEGVSTFRI